MVTHIAIILLFLLNIFCILDATTVGSNTIVSIEAAATFTPISESNPTANTVAGFGWMKNGFTLQDSTTTCSFGSVFPVAGTIALNGGQLWLTTNLLCGNDAKITSNGYIHGNNYEFDLSESVTWWSRTTPMYLDNTNIFLDNDLNITGTVNFRGTCIFDARNHRVTFNPGAMLDFSPNSLVTFKNVELYGLNNQMLQLADNSVGLILDNMRLVESSDVHFTKGSILFSNEVNFVGAKSFYYESALTSTIDTDSTWFLSDVTTLRMGRKNGIHDREPLFFEDRSSKLRMENSTLSVTSSGMNLTRGQFVGDGQVNLSMDSTIYDAGLALGDGTDDNNFYFSLYPEAVLNLAKGHFIYNIIGSKSGFVNDEVNMRFIKKNAGSHFLTKQDLRFTNVNIKANPASSTAATTGKNIYFNNVLVQASPVDFVVTATRTSEYSYLLAGDGLLQIQFGRYPLMTRITGKNNKIGGIGTITGPIALLNGGAEVTIDLSGKFDTNIVMAGSKITLAGDLIFDRETKITGSGNVVSGGYDVYVDLNSKDWTSTVTWTATDSVLSILSDMNIKSCLTFGGIWVIDGGGKTINLDTTGSIVVNPNSSLYFKNINITGNKNQKLRCADHSGKIFFDEVAIYLDDAYTFKTGSFEVYNNFDVLGNTSFYYQSALTSTIHKRASFTMRPGTTIEIGRKNGYNDREPLYFDDRSATLSLDNATFSVTSSGVTLTRGKINLTHAIITDLKGLQPAGGLTLGNQTAIGDFEIEWNPGASLNLPHGYALYNGYSPNLLVAKAKNSSLNVGDNARLYMNTDVHIKNLIIYTTAGFQVIVAPGQATTYENYQIIYGSSQYEVTARFYDNQTLWLNGLSSISVTTGSVPSAIYVTGSDNWFYGTGNILGPVFMGDSTSQLIFSLLGTIYSDITMNDGTILLDKRMSLGPKIQIRGTGLVQQLSEAIFIDGRDTTWTGTITWDGGGGIVQLMSDLKLSSAWTFVGDCMLDGNGFNIDLRDTGQIIVGSDATLRLKNITIKEVSDNRIRCADNSGTLLLDNSSLVLSDDTNFAAGTLNILGSSGISGDKTTFAFRSPQQSQIMSRASLTLDDGLLFSYEPPIASRTLFKFADRTGRLILDTATIHSTSTGLQLLQGALEVKGRCSLTSDATYQAEGVLFGDGVSAANDLDIIIYPAANLHVASGWVIDKNIN